MLVHQLPAHQATEEAAKHGKEDDERKPPRGGIITDKGINVALLHAAGEGKGFVGIPEKLDRQKIHAVVQQACHRPGRRHFLF